MTTRRLVIVGAGAAGSMAAIWAARRARTHADSLEVLLIERTRDGGRKILISGGGRCNVLPSTSQPERFVTDSSPHTLRKILRSWPLHEQRDFFEHDLDLPLVLEADTGKLFPASGRAMEVRDRLRDLVEREGVRSGFRQRVTAVEQEALRWRLRFEEGESIEADAVVIATGGLSVPTTGSDGFGLALARQLGHAIVDPYPALTPLLGGTPAHHALAGISSVVALTAPSKNAHARSRGGFLFTHRGFSGPAVLDLSHHVVRGAGPGTLHVRWVETDESALESELRAAAGRTVGQVLRRHLPERLAACLADEAGVALHSKLAELRREARKRLLATLLHWPLPASGHEGYRKAEVTGGGVHLSEVEPRTLQSKRCPGLYFCGEVLDAFGPIGGHNFAWAWSSGKAAGEAAAEALAER